MNEHDYRVAVATLPPAQKRVFDALCDNGPLDDHELGAALDTDGTRSGFTTRRGELVKLGLVREAGRRGRRRLWEVTPPAEVEAERERATQVTPRLRVIRRFRDLPLETRWEIAMAIADDEELQNAISDPQGAATRRQRNAFKKAVQRRERNRREDARRLKEALEQELPGVEAMRFRQILRESNDAIRAIRALYDEERERPVLLSEAAVPDAEWERILHEIEEGIRQHELVYELIAPLIGAPSRRVVDIELGEGDVVEDAEYELVATLGPDEA
jgi:hypothetical protein